jgi:hypothetical protein
MTFLEAAIEVLRRTDEALHFSEVAKRAVDAKLLSHVGRDPEAAMRTCLNSAVRAARSGDEPVLMRAKPGYYQVRPGAELPPAAPGPIVVAPPIKVSDSRAEEGNVKEKTQGSRGDSRNRKRRTKTARGEAPAPASVEVLPVRTKRTDTSAPARSRSNGRSSRGAADDASSDSDDLPDTNVEFEAPSGSGLEGITDVALVMANAMSRLVEERPELRDELDAIQQENNGGGDGHGEPRSAANTRSPARPSREPAREPEERGGRRRRRRRRRGKRVDWGSPAADAQSAAVSLNDRLLDGVAEVLKECGPRSLHVRQVAETLASKGLLGGEISEIERAVTAAILADTQSHGRASRFVARGDARYQLQGTRLPDKAAKAEDTLRLALLAVDRETTAQLIVWLQSLGARALESLVRIWLQREGFGLRSALPPNRGLGKLVVEDPEPEEEDGRTLVLVIPKRTGLDPSLWEGEAQRHSCPATLAFVMSDGAEGYAGLGDARIVGAAELAAWLVEHGVGVQRIAVQATVLDPTLIESIGGLDT